MRYALTTTCARTLGSCNQKEMAERSAPGPLCGTFCHDYSTRMHSFIVHSKAPYLSRYLKRIPRHREYEPDTNLVNPLESGHIYSSSTAHIIAE